MSKNTKDNTSLLKKCKFFKNGLKHSLNSQGELKKTLEQFKEKLFVFIEEGSDINSDETISNIEAYISLCSNNINRISDMLNSLDSLRNDASVVSTVGKSSFKSDISEKFDNFNDDYSGLQEDIRKNTYTIYKFLLSLINSFDLPLSDFEIHESQIKKMKSFTSSDNSIENTDETSLLTDNRTLIISEKDGKVYLPYYIKDLQELLKNFPETYSSIEDVIEKKYIVPLDKYKHPFTSRFKEAYNLMRYKENASFLRCLDLAFELTWNTLLNPAIISACSNLDELDIYLDYLYSNELDKFSIFEIKYEMNPI